MPRVVAEVRLQLVGVPAAEGRGVDVGPRLDDLAVDQVPGVGLVVDPAAREVLDPVEGLRRLHRAELVEGVAERADRYHLTDLLPDVEEGRVCPRVEEERRLCAEAGQDLHGPVVGPAVARVQQLTEQLLVHGRLLRVGVPAQRGDPGVAGGVAAEDLGAEPGADGVADEDEAVVGLLQLLGRHVEPVDLQGQGDGVAVRGLRAVARAGDVDDDGVVTGVPQHLVEALVVEVAVGLVLARPALEPEAVDEQAGEPIAAGLRDLHREPGDDLGRGLPLHRWTPGRRRVATTEAASKADHQGEGKQSAVDHWSSFVMWRVVPHNSYTIRS